MFENENEDDGWIINIDDIIDSKKCNTLPDVSDKVKEGDVVIGVFFGGGYEAYLMKLIEISGDEGPSLGAADDDTCYDITFAWGIFDYDEYKKLDPEFEYKLKGRKYNL
jgi:hypothetical protein